MTHATARGAAAAEQAPLILPPHILAALTLPALDALTPDQAAGRVCVWEGEPLTLASSIGLGEPVTHGDRWFPQGCHRCVQLAVLAAVKTHPAGCRQCAADETQCGTRRDLHALALEMRRGAW
ncbi:hypothetical protein ACF09I_34650 [Streptomyces sp. NPDC014940]|uniref:hypothetical protein n=1 Tax=Streptomyces sp. NPDC014940 TaxID=3364932 RepID=UPI0036F58069